MIANGEAMIYVVEILDWRFAKVGYSADPDISKRIAQLQTGCPFEIKLGLSIEGTLSQEKTLHSLLDDAFGSMGHLIPPNEWYPGRSDFFKEFCESLSYGFNFALAVCAKFSQASRANRCEQMEWNRVRKEWPQKKSQWMGSDIGQQEFSTGAPHSSIKRDMLRKRKHIPRRIAELIND